MIHLFLLTVICASVPDCVAASHAALEAGDVVAAEKAALVGLRLSECEHETAATSDGAQVLARIALRRKEPLMARAWLQPAPWREGQPARDLILQREIAAAVNAISTATSPVGRYSEALRWGLWNEVEITEASTSRFRFRLSAQVVAASACRPEAQAVFRSGSPGDAVQGLADAEGEAVRQDNAYVYESRDSLLGENRTCRIFFHIGSDILHVAQESLGQDCGFGAFADVSGDYVRTK